MTLLHTESYKAFGTYNGTDAYESGANAAREATRLNLMRAEYEVHVAANSSEATSGGFVIRADAIEPTYNALVHSSGIAVAADAGVTAALRKTLPNNDKQILLGFALYIPQDFVPNAVTSTVPCLRMAATLKSDTSWWTAAISSNTSAKELFRICNDLSLRWGTDVPQTSKRLRAGQMNYVEVRISPTEVSVWLDDVFIMQKQVSVVAETVAWIFENNINTGGTNMSAAPGRWAINHMYLLSNDGAGNTVRLGPTTRVKGVRPVSDVDVDFSRPSDAPSNASVAAQDLTDAPARMLSSNTIGDSDIYSSGGPTDVAGSPMIHAIAVKSLAANLEPDPHAVRSFVNVGGNEGSGVRGKELVQVGSVPGARTIRAMAIRPSDQRVFAVGDGSSIYCSGTGYNYSTWSKVADAGDGNQFVGIAFRADGQGVAAMRTTSGGNRNYTIPPTATTINMPGVANVDYVSITTVTHTLLGLILGTDGATFIDASDFSATVGTSIFKTSTDLVTWTSRSANIPGLTGGTANMAKSANRIIAPLINQGGYFVRSDNNGTAWTGASNGDPTVPYPAITYDGAAWLMGAYSNDAALGGGPRIRRSTDNGGSWNAVTPIGTDVAGPNQALRGGVSNQSINESLFFGDGGAVVASTDGLNWRQMPRLTTAALYAGVALPSGDILIGGAAGTLLAYRTQTLDKTLLPLSGFQMAFNAVSINPATGLPFTPAQAAAANFGVKLVS